nr:pancreatic triacylglycerol lipase-like [Halyomorpha halys]
MAFGNCSAKWVGYQFYDRKHAEYGQYVEVTATENNLNEAGFDWNKPVTVIIPGYAETTHRFEMIALKRELLKHSDMSVLIMDWSKLTNDWYITAVINAHYAGRCLADLINTLGRPSAGLHVIGFSLGGEVPGTAATFLAPYKIPRITGLDPAFPFFWGWISQKRLSKDDAEFVDVIHTNAFFKGHVFPLGHVDFFINGGVIQPGCKGGIYDIIDCSHLRAPLYFAESINSKIGFWGCKTSYFKAFFEACKPDELSTLMGYHVDQKLRGIFRLNTNSQSPYAEGNTVENKTLLIL